MAIKKYWQSMPPAECEICNVPITDKFYDAKTTQGPWGCLCQICFDVYTPRLLGLGAGQKYEKQANGRWLKTGG